MWNVSYWRKSLQDNWLLFTLLAGLILFPHVIGWLTDSSPFGSMRGSQVVMLGKSVRWQSVLIEVFSLGILAMSYNLLFGFTGVVSFGHALFFGMGAYLPGVLLEFTSLDNLTALIVGIGGSIVVCALLALAIGVVSLRLHGVYFAIFTLAIAETFLVIFRQLQLTNGEDGFSLTALPAWIDPQQSRLNFYYVSLAAFVLSFMLIRRLMHSPTGAVFKAIRENEERAQIIGYNTLNFKLLSITIAGVLASIAGLMLAMLNKKVGPQLLSVNYTVEPLLSTIIGGVGTFSGPVIGSGGLHLLETFFRDNTFTVFGTTIEVAKYWDLIRGVIFIGVVLIFPQGVVGTYQRWRANRQNRTQHTATIPMPPAEVQENAPVS